MDFRTIVDIEKPKWQIEPAERILFVGSCFADRIGQRSRIHSEHSRRLPAEQQRDRGHDAQP